MVRIAITNAAYEAISATLPLGSVPVDAEPNQRGERTVWLEDVWVDRLGTLRKRLISVKHSTCSTYEWKS
jgi:hypothetical protein